MIEMTVQGLIPQISTILTKIKEFVVVVVAGSISYGTSTSESDIDLIVYYHKDSPPSIISLKKYLTKVDLLQVQKVSEIGEWNRFMNGGCYLTYRNKLVHIYYREIEETQHYIDYSKKGKFDIGYFDLPMNIFKTYYFCGHIRDYIVAHDPHGIIKRWKNQIKYYPKVLQKSVVRHHLIDVENTLPDLSSMSTGGYLFNFFVLRIINNYIQILYALNKRYFTTEKRIISEIRQFSKKPDNFLNHINNINFEKKNGLKHTTRELFEMYDYFTNEALPLYEANYVNEKFKEWF